MLPSYDHLLYPPITLFIASTTCRQSISITQQRHPLDCAHFRFSIFIQCLAIHTSFRLRVLPKGPYTIIMFLRGSNELGALYAGLTSARWREMCLIRWMSLRDVILSLVFTESSLFALLSIHSMNLQSSQPLVINIFSSITSVLNARWKREDKSRSSKQKPYKLVCCGWSSSRLQRVWWWII